MWRLLVIVLILIIGLAFADFVISKELSDKSIITITSKYIKSDRYFVETMSLQTFEMSKSVYSELDIGTYNVITSGNTIIKVIKRIN